jgi:hypothetical protein
MHIVKCLYCQKEFDRDKIKCQKIGRRYAHLICDKKTDGDEINFNIIVQYSNRVLGDTANIKKISKQIKDYQIQGMSYNEIYLTLKYWYEIKKNSPDKSKGGIGIVPYVYNDAMTYWKSLKQIAIPKLETEEIMITPKRRKKIVLSMEDDENGQL